MPEMRRSRRRGRRMRNDPPKDAPPPIFFSAMLVMTYEHNTIHRIEHDTRNTSVSVT